MLEKKLVFDFEYGKDNEILLTSDLMRIFWAHFYKDYERPDIQLFHKVEKSSNGSVRFDIPVTYVVNNKSETIHELDDIRFVSEAMIAVKQHRMIDDEVYKRIAELGAGEGEYILAVNEKPAYRVTIGPDNGLVYKTVIFESYDKKGSFKRDIILDKEGHLIRQVGLEFSVADKKKYKLFVGIYKQVLKEYQKLGLKEGHRIQTK